MSADETKVFANRTDNNDAQEEVEHRRTFQWLMWPFVPIVIAFGWKYPILGYIFPTIGLSIFLTSLLPGKGRFHCGNFCPRGATYDRVISRISLDMGIPSFLRKWYFRGIPFLIVPTMITLKILSNPGYAWWEWLGHCFWILCTVTTAVGLPFSLLFGHRSWCSFCPMGTLQNLLVGHKYQLQIDDDKCIECGACEEVCPMHLPILDYKDEGVMEHRDCIKCSECLAACPQDALSWPREDQ